MHVIGSFAFALVVVVPLWRLFERAGLTPALALLVLIPYVGIVLVALILAFSAWRGGGARLDAYGQPYQPDLFDGKPR
jgi:hypothetical protein